MDSVLTYGFKLKFQMKFNVNNTFLNSCTAYPYEAVVWFVCLVLNWTDFSG